ncbi:MAG: hypothetical protein ACE5G3_03740 [Gammaproteobacteria bacterium]
MSILFYVLTFLACVATAAAGAWAMRRRMESRRDVPEDEDPRDAKIRDLLAQVRMARDDLTRSRTMAHHADEHVRLAHEHIDRLNARITALTGQATAGESDLEQTHAEKDLLRDKLSVASRQVDTLKERNQELEMELSLAREPDMLDPVQQQDTAHPTDEDLDELDAISTPDVDETAPSLLHSLTLELERWKRHCHVLGGELKLQRERGAGTGDGPGTGENPFDSIDELTDIRGIGQAIERKLHQLGVYRYRELASLAGDDLERARTLIPDVERRMARGRWRDQARELHRDKYREPL